MPLFMPQDPPDSLGEFKPLGPAKKPQPKEEPVTLEKTGTPGIVRNSKTGKLETQLPEPLHKLVPLEKPTDKNMKLAGEILEALKAKRNFTVSTPRQRGKSLITEMYKKYAAINPRPGVVLKGRPDMIMLDDLTEDNRDDWMKWIK